MTSTTHLQNVNVASLAHLQQTLQLQHDPSGFKFRVTLCHRTHHHDVFNEARAKEFTACRRANLWRE